MTSTIYSNNNINDSPNNNINHSSSSSSPGENNNNSSLDDNNFVGFLEEDVQAQVEIGDDDEDDDDDRPPPSLSPILPIEHDSNLGNNGRHNYSDGKAGGGSSWGNTNGNGASTSSTPNESISGVSRSGRVRKKNSLLAGYDYDTSDAIPDKAKKYKNEYKTPKRSASPDILSTPHSSSSSGKHKGRRGKKSRGRPRKYPLKQHAGVVLSNRSAHSNSYLSDDVEGDLEIDLPHSFGEDDIDLATEEVIDQGHSLFDEDSMTSGEMLHSASLNRLKSQAQSTYMMEKTAGGHHRKTTHPNASTAGVASYSSMDSYPSIGKIKIPKKEKLGQQKRLTGYLLWAQEQKNNFTQKFPHMDYGPHSKKLTEKWSALPSNQKKLWKIRASKTMKGGTADNIKNSGKILPPKKPPGKRGRKSKAELLAMQMAALNPASQASIPGPSTSVPVLPKVPGKRGRKKKTDIWKQKKEPSSVNGVPSVYRNNYKQRVKYAALLEERPSTSKQTRVSPKKEVEIPKYKVTGHESFDVAAHLSLLGESLTNIGDRLKQHEGDKVSGSLSVLLDTLLCATGPLLCLTQEVKELNCIPPEKLSSMLDCFAMIMPGI